jgi:hypothetical protein
MRQQVAWDLLEYGMSMAQHIVAWHGKCFIGCHKKTKKFYFGLATLALFSILSLMQSRLSRLNAGCALA